MNNQRMTPCPRALGSFEVCEICKLRDQETRSILSSLLDSCREAQQGESHLHANLHEKFQRINLQKLIRMVFWTKYSNFRYTLICDHEIIREYFCDKLACSPKQLDLLSEKIAWRRAKYQFHLDVVNQQTRSFPRLLSRNPENPQSSKKVENVQSMSLRGSKQLQEPSKAQEECSEKPKLQKTDLHNDGVIKEFVPQHNTILIPFTYDQNYPNYSYWNVNPAQMNYDMGLVWGLPVQNKSQPDIDEEDKKVNDLNEG